MASSLGRGRISLRLRTFRVRICGILTFKDGEFMSELMRLIAEIPQNVGRADRLCEETEADKSYR
jgi:hypothetical protein